MSIERGGGGFCYEEGTCPDAAADPMAPKQSRPRPCYGGGPNGSRETEPPASLGEGPGNPCAKEPPTLIQRGRQWLKRHGVLCPDGVGATAIAL